MCRALPCEEAPEPDPACAELHVAADGELRRKDEHCFDADNHPLYVRVPNSSSMRTSPSGSAWLCPSFLPRCARRCGGGSSPEAGRRGRWTPLHPTVHRLLAGTERRSSRGWLRRCHRRRTHICPQAAVTEKGGQAWLQAFIQALAETPLLVTFQPSMKLFKNLLDLPYVLQQQQQP